MLRIEDNSIPHRLTSLLDGLPPPSSWDPAGWRKLLILNDLTDADRIYACNAIRGLYELDFQRKDSWWNLFLHGLGQDVSLGKESNLHFHLALKTFDIFSHPKKAIRKSKKVDGAPPARERSTLYLVGLSLGGVLALDLLQPKTSRNSRAWSLRNSIQTQHQSPSIGSRFPFSSASATNVFEKQDNKQQMLQILTERTQSNRYC